MKNRPFTQIAPIGAILALAMTLIQPALAQEQKVDTPPMPAWQNLYVGDFGGNQIHKIAADGSTSVYAEKVGSVNQLVFTDDGTLYASSASGVIWKITPTEDGSPATRENGHLEEFITDLSRPRAFTIDPEGNFWVGEFFGKDILDENGEHYKPRKAELGSLLKITPEGERIVIEEQFNQPYGATTGPDGLVYIAQLGGFKLHRYTLDGQSTILLEGGEKNGGVYWLRNVAFNPKGELHLLGGKGIYKLLPDRKVSEVCLWKNDGFRGIHQVGLAFDANGTLYSAAAPEKGPGAEKLGYVHKHGSDGRSHEVLGRFRQPFFLAFYPTRKPETMSNNSEKK